MPSVIKSALPLLGLLGGAVLVIGGVVLLARAGGAPVETPQAAVAENTAPAAEMAEAVPTAEADSAGEAAGIPPIDAAAPAEVETATFALG
jgi:hypothetical protein